MKIIIAAGGSCRKGPHFEMWTHYFERLHPKPVLRETGDEPQALRNAVRDMSYKIALDENGRQISTLELSEAISNAMLHAVPTLGFIIGGAFGIPKDILDTCDKSIAFGKCTWPHLLVRGLLAEQLYRAQQIRAGHPYHHA